MTNSNADKFCSLFSSFSLVIRPVGETSRHKASKEDVEDLTDYKTKSQIKQMLKKANEDYSQAKKLFKHGKISKEELYDYEWRVFELRDELDKFNDEGVQ